MDRLAVGIGTVVLANGRPGRSLGRVSHESDTGRPSGPVILDVERLDTAKAGEKLLS